MRIQTSPEMPIRISPQAKVLPANTLRFYIHFPRPGEAHFDRDQLWLLDEEDQVVPDPFLVLSQELWSRDGRRLTVLMEPGRIKRGLGADPSHEPALVVGRTYSLVITALGQTARHTFRVGDPVLEAIDEAAWRIVPPNAGSLDPAVVNFGRVMDAALCDDEIRVVTASGAVVPTRASPSSDGTALQLIPSQPWGAGEHSLVVSDRFEDVCGNRLGEALDHDLGAAGRPRAGRVSFTPGRANARLNHDARRERILDVAQEVFLEAGFAKASMTTIATRLGGSKGTLYHYFNSKDELFTAYVERRCLWRDDEVFNLPPSATPEMALHQIARSFLAHAANETIVRNFRLIVAEAERTPQVSHLFYEAGPRRSTLRLADFLSSLEAQGVLALDGDALGAAQHLLGLVQSATFKGLLCNTVAQPTPAEIDAEAARGVKAFLRAYGSHRQGANRRRDAVPAYAVQ
jgi:AcrR family transcriptional regulator